MLCHARVARLHGQQLWQVLSGVSSCMHVCVASLQTGLGWSRRLSLVAVRAGQAKAVCFALKLKHAEAGQSSAAAAPDLPVHRRRAGPCLRPHTVCRQNWLRGGGESEHPAAVGVQASTSACRCCQSCLCTPAVYVSASSVFWAPCPRWPFPSATNPWSWQLLPRMHMHVSGRGLLFLRMHMSGRCHTHCVLCWF